MTGHITIPKWRGCRGRRRVLERLQEGRRRRGLLGLDTSRRRRTSDDDRRQLRTSDASDHVWGFAIVASLDGAAAVVARVKLITGGARSVSAAAKMRGAREALMPAVDVVQNRRDSHSRCLPRWTCRAGRSDPLSGHGRTLVARPDVSIVRSSPLTSASDRSPSSPC